jgi:hypothetical protein
MEESKEEKKIDSPESCAEKDKEREFDLNTLFPGKEYDLNRLFPDAETKKLLYELRRNKRDIQRFIKNLDIEGE